MDIQSSRCCVPCSPWSPVDPELEALRRLQRLRQIEEEKQRLRDWLWAHGYPACPQQGLFPPWVAPVAPPVPGRPPCPPPRGVGEVLQKLG